LRPFVVDHSANVCPACGAHGGLVGRRERSAVADDLGDAGSFLARIGPRVTVGLEGEHDHEGQQQAEQAGNDTEQLGRDLDVETVLRHGDDSPDEPDTEQGKADDQDHDDHGQHADRHRVDH